MTPPVFAPFYNDRSLTLLEIKRIFEEGAVNRKVAAHHPIVATIDMEGRPSQRVMILRDCNWALSTLRFHSDLRSNKIAQVSANNDASVLIYDVEAKIQVRLTGKASLGTDAAAQAAWEASTEFARRCYMVQSAPGSETNAAVSGLPAWIEGKKPSEELLVSARENFATLYFTFDSIDWLYLANSGHRRARFVRDLNTNEWDARWLIP